MVSENRIITEDIRRIATDIESISSDLSGKTILIAGGAGFLGKYLVLTLNYLNEHILEKPCTILVIDNFITGSQNSAFSNPHVRLIKHDICKPFDIKEDIHYIINAASIASPVFYHRYRLETIDVGILGTRNLLELAREKKVHSFLFFSSSEIYGNPDPKFIPTPEDYLGNVSCTGPRACYDEPKRIGETLCVTYSDIFSVPVKILRPFNIYGPGMKFDDGRVIPNFVVSALRGEKLPVYGNGRNTRTFCYISDATVGFFQTLLSDHNGESFNIGADDQEIEMRHLAETILGLVENQDSSAQATQSSLEVYQKSDPNRRCPDLTKIRTMIGYRPKISLIVGLKRFISWAREELENSTSGIVLEKECRNCGSRDLRKFISFGKTPLANNLSSPSQKEEDEKFPLEVNYCGSCHLCQLSYVCPPEKMFKHYVYITSTSETFKKHFKKMAEDIVSSFKLQKNALVVDIGSNDGLLLQNFKSQGMRVLGIEPAQNIAEIARSQGIETINEFFSQDVAENILKFTGKADVVTANNIFAHVANIKDFVKNVKLILKEQGIFCIEVQYLLDTIKDLTFDNIYHEHLSYFSVMTLSDFFSRHNMNIFHVEHVNTHGGSIRVFVQKNEGTHKEDKSVQEFIQKEKNAKLDSLATYDLFAQRVYHIRDKFKTFISGAKKENKTVAGYGAPAKATTLLNFCGIANTQIDFIVDENKLKQGLLVPGVKIPITPVEKLDQENPDYIVVLAWNFAPEIIAKVRSRNLPKSKIVLSFPEFKIVDSNEDGVSDQNNVEKAIVK